MLGIGLQFRSQDTITWKTGHWCLTFCVGLTESHHLSLLRHTKLIWRIPFTLFSIVHVMWYRSSIFVNSLGWQVYQFLFNGIWGHIYPYILWPTNSTKYLAYLLTRFFPTLFKVNFSLIYTHTHARFFGWLTGVILGDDVWSQEHAGLGAFSF